MNRKMSEEMSRSTNASTNRSVGRDKKCLRRLVPALFVFSAVLSGAQDTPGGKSEAEPEVRIDLEYSMKTDLSVLESREIRSAVLRRIRALYPRGDRSRRENLALLADAQLLSSMYPGIQNPADRADALALLLGIRDEFLSYAAARPGDYEIKNELAFLVGIGFPAFAEDDFYRSVRLTQELAAQVYNAMPNAKAAYILGQGYLAANPSGRPAIADGLGEDYLNEAIDLDKGSGVVSYMAHIVLADYHYRMRRTAAARRSLNRAFALYPDGFLAYLAEQAFAAGRSFFQGAGG